MDNVTNAEIEAALPADFYRMHPSAQAASWDRTKEELQRTAPWVNFQGERFTDAAANKLWPFGHTLDFKPVGA